MARCYPEFSIN